MDTTSTEVRTPIRVDSMPVWLVACAMEMEAAPLRAHLRDVRAVASPLGSLVSGFLPVEGALTSTNSGGASGSTRPVSACPDAETHRLGVVGAAVEPANGSATLCAAVPVVLYVSGIGLVNAAACATVACTMFPQARGLICGGTCGGLAASTAVRDVIVGSSFAYSRADARCFGYAPGQVPKEPAVFDGCAELVEAAARAPRVLTGQVVSSDAFITADTVEDTRELFPNAIGADMESAAVAHVCSKLGVPFVSVRGVSDLCGPAADAQFHIDGAEAARISADAVVSLLRATHLSGR